MRTLVLFDIDGTLVRGGPAKEAFGLALTEEFGTEGRVRLHEFAGKTDPQIARELLTDAGFSHKAVDRGLPRVWARYLEELERRLMERPMQLLPGVVVLLDALEGSGEVGLGLVTGNIADGARLKLGSAGLVGRFPVGGFGSDHEERQHLPRVAIDRAALRFRVDFEKDRIFVVGDTPRDVACGLHEGVRTLAVATGNFRHEALREAGAHAVFDDFSATDQVVTSIMTG